jgi:hypothetical protein
MSDEFLTQFREVPRTEFADALYTRISQQQHFAQTMLKKITCSKSVIVFIFRPCLCCCVEALEKAGEIWCGLRKHKR